MKTQDQIATERKRKFLLLLPVMVLPFLLLLLWTLGLAPSTKGPAKPEESKVNMELPEASFQHGLPQDKMSFYAQAIKDSTQRMEQSRQDPNFHLEQKEAVQELDLGGYGPQGLNPSVYGGPFHNDATEEKIYHKLGELNSVINQPAPPTPGYGPGPATGPAPAVPGNELDRLEQMMERMQQGPEGGDPEMQQINSMLEKIMAIQHPEQAREKLNRELDQKRGEVYAVSADVEDNPVTIIPPPVSAPKNTGNGFYGLTYRAIPEADNNTIAAVIHDNQEIVSGAIVKMRLINDVMVRGELVPKNTYLFGLAQISGERLNIQINSIRYHNSIYPVKLSVYDLDGMDGIHIPGAISREVAKASGSDALQGIGINSFDPNLATQAASAGIELSKNLINKKVKLVKVSLKAGYKVLLKDQHPTSN